MRYYYSKTAFRILIPVCIAVQLPAPLSANDACDERLESAKALVEDYKYYRAISEIESLIRNTYIVRGKVDGCTQDGIVALAGVYYVLEKYDDARKLLLEVIDCGDCKKSNRRILCRQSKLLMAYLEQAEGNLDVAEKYANEVLSFSSDKLSGDDLLVTARAYDELADITNDRREYSKAMEYNMRLADLYKRNLENKILRHIGLYRYLITLVNMGKNNEANEIFSTMEKDDVDNIDTGIKIKEALLLAKVMLNLGKRADAKNIVMAEIEYITRKKGEDSGYMVGPLVLLALIESVDGANDSARKHLNLARRFASEIYGANHSKVSEIDVGIASLEYGCGRHKEALGILIKAKERVEERLGKRSPKLATLLEKIADVQYGEDNLKSSYETLLQLREIQMHMYGHKNEQTRTTEDKIRWAERQLAKRKNDDKSQ